MGAPRFVQNGLEDIYFRLYASADRAYALGEKHFNATDADQYDVRRAQRFFRIAATMDPQHPVVHHELARIDFLNGYFISALARINFQIQQHGSTVPNSYYIRGLIEGYIGEYTLAALDYERYLQFDPTNWAANNDLAWVLLKAGRLHDALEAIDRGLTYFPTNPWLLNSRAIALYELGEYDEAGVSARKASVEVEKLKAEDWLRAYPGNDPRVAAEGIAAFTKAVQDNMHRIEVQLKESNVQ